MSRVIVATAILLVLSAAMLASVLWIVADLRRANDGLRDSTARIETANHLLGRVVDLATGVRGYTLTRNPALLSTFYRAIAALPGDEREFLAAAKGDPRREAAARKIVAAVRQNELWQRGQLATALTDPRKAIRQAATGEGTRRIDAVRAQTSALEARERTTRARLNSKVDAASQRTTQLIVIGLIGVPLLGIVLAVWLARGVVAPLRRVTAAARRLTAGDLEARVDERAPGEIGEVARAFNDMADALEAGRENLETHNAELSAQGAELANAVKELELEHARLETFHAVVAALAVEAELEPLSVQVLGVLRAAASATAGALYVVDPIDAERGIALSLVEGLDRDRLPDRLTPAAGLPWRAADELAPIAASGDEATLGFRHELHLPLVHGDRALGVLTLAKAGDPWFEEVDVLWRMTDAAAVGLSNALRLESARHQARVTRAVLETANDAYIAVDDTLHVATWTPQAEALFGYTEAEAVGARVDELLIPERWRPGYRSIHQSIVADSGGARRRFELPVLHKDGSRLQVELSVSPLRVGGRMRLNGFVRDIGDRLAGERAREAQRAVSQALAETAPDETLMPRVLKALGAALRCSAAIHWLPDPSSRGMRCAAVWSDPQRGGDELATMAQSALITGDAAPLRACRTNEPVYAAVDDEDALPLAADARRSGLAGAIAVPITCGPDGLGVLELWQRRSGAPPPEIVEALGAISGLVGEVLERRRAAADAQRLKDEFFALISHELRTPLTSISGYVELLIDEEAGEISPDQRRFLAVIERNAQRLQRLVGDLLFAAQVEAGSLSLDRRSVDLGAVLREAAATGRPRAEKGQVELVVDSEDVPPVEGDPDRLGQVVDNLISNAIKFTPPGGRVTVRLRRSEECARIEVQDTGIGIPAAEHERLFERFYRASSATERSIQGVGLGLSISRAIVQAHGGTIVFESDEGHGTTFVIELPLVTPRASADPQPERRLVHER